MKNIVLAAIWFVLLALPFLAFSQTEKGVNPVAQPSTVNPEHSGPSTVRAVVIGISDYQEKDIPDLRFADRDAEAFANFLRSPAGPEASGLDNDHLQILTNQNATLGNIAAALDWLLDASKEGDEAIIYFSGHGDVERKTISQPGYLLCWDAPARVYMAGGAFNVRDMQEVVATLSTQNKAKVVVVTDACHAGKLAGSQIGGSQATAANLAKQFANEVKILSCQPNEFSLEGEQWGGGRGVFSYHLVDGLAGLADRNGDGQVSVGEIDRYLEDHVTAEAAPQSQVPMLLGNKTERLATVNAAILADLKKAKASTETSGPVFAATEGRGFEGEVLAKADSSIREQYLAFKNAVREQRFFRETENVIRASNASDDAPTADELSAQLSENEALAPLRGMMKRNYAAALQNEVQQDMNALLEADPAEVNHWRCHPEKYAQYPAYLARAIALLGEQHYMYKPLMAKKRYFEAYNLNRSLDQVQDPAFRDSVKAIAKKKLLEGLTYEPDAAYLYHAIGYLYLFHNPCRTDSMLLYINRATALSPNWALPYADMASEMSSVGDYEESEHWVKKLLAIKPENYSALENYAKTCLLLNRVEEAKATCSRLIEMRPDVPTGYQLMTWAALQKQDYKAAEHYAKKRIAVEEEQFSSSSYGDFRAGGASVDLCRVLNRTKRYREGMTMLHSAFTNRALSDFELIHEKANACFEHGDFACAKAAADSMSKHFISPHILAIAKCFAGKTAFRMGDLAAAEMHLVAGIEADPMPNEHDAWLFAYMGLVKEKQGKLEEARQWFEQAEGYPYWYSIFPIKIDSKFLYGEFLLRQQQPEKALEKFNFILDNCPNDYRGWYGMALYHAFRKEDTLALDNLEKALEHYYPVPQPMLEDPLLQNILKTKRCKAMMKKHFPPASLGDKVKD